MKRYLKRMLALFAAVCCVCGALLPVHSASAAEGDTPRVVFENAQNDTPDLYISKTVTSASGNYDAPEDLRFSFILKLDGKLADREEYRVFNEAGNEVYRYQEGESAEDKPNKLSFQTDRSGLFTLAPGQTAKFEYVGTGVSYEVTEVAREGWTQIQPAGGAPAVGTVTAKGAWAQFVNLIGGEGGAATSLMVRKDIAFPEGYKAPETPEFPFTLTLGGKPWSQETYTIEDTKTGEAAGTGVTGTDGSFSLRGGQTAVFEGIPQDTDYKVTEGETEGWWAVGETSQEGSTGNGGTVVAAFTNASASFAVTKTMEDNSVPQEDFTFLLTTGERQVWADAAYLLYQTNGEPVLDDDGNAVSGKTDATGRFSLRPGQAALFTGIEPGSLYNVSEDGRSDYIQTVPSSASGYTDKVVSGAVEVLPFVNKPAEGGLTVTKVIDNSEGEAPLEQKEFTFVLRKQTGEDVYEPMGSVEYSIETGATQNTYRTGENGELRIKANETARFTGLPAGTYQVEEMAYGLEYIPQETVYTGELSSSNANLSFVFTNTYNSRGFDLYLLKQDSGREHQALKGAEFMLYRDELNNNPVQEKPFVTDREGKIVMTGMKTGTYYLKETKAPAGYQLLTNPVKITVTWLDDEMQVSVDDHTVTSNDEDDQIHIVQTEGGNDQVHVVIYNSKNFVLPLTGGSAVFLGAALIGAVAVLFVMWKKGRGAKQS